MHDRRRVQRRERQAETGRRHHGQAAIEKEGLELTYMIGPKTAHALEPNTKKEIDKLIDAAVARGRDNLPKKIRFTTYTLRYPQMHWIRLDGLDEHWKRAARR